jgi:hypothetical protein
MALSATESCLYIISEQILRLIRADVLKILGSIDLKGVLIIIDFGATGASRKNVRRN